MDSLIFFVKSEICFFFFFMLKNEFRACFLRSRQDIMHFAKYVKFKVGLSSCQLRFIVTVCVFVRHLFLWYPFYFDFHSARIIFDVSSGFYLWNINNTKADFFKKL